MKSKSRVGALLIATLMLGLTAGFGQSTVAAPESRPAGNPTAPTQPKTKQTSGPFHGRLKSVDLATKSIVMGTRTFHANGETKITRDGKPATLKDGVVGENVSGYFKTAEDGKLVLSSLRFGPKTAAETPAKKGTAPK